MAIQVKRRIQSIKCIFLSVRGAFKNSASTPLLSRVRQSFYMYASTTFVIVVNLKVRVFMRCALDLTSSSSSLLDRIVVNPSSFCHCIWQATLNVQGPLLGYGILKWGWTNTASFFFFTVVWLAAVAGRTPSWPRLRRTCNRWPLLLLWASQLVQLFQDSKCSWFASCPIDQKTVTFWTNIGLVN